MAKGLPYFKFFPSEWMVGDIVYESFEVQGLFINICALYWQRDGVLTIDEVQKRYKMPVALPSLTDRFIFVKDGNISIKFLDEQLVERGHISTVNSANGKKGGEAKALLSKGKKRKMATAKRPLSEPVANPTQLEVEEELKVEPTPLQTFVLSLENVSGLKSQLTQEQSKKLTDKFHKDLLKKKLLAMENKKDLQKKYSSVYLTLNSWCEMSNEEVAKQQAPQGTI